MVGIGEGVDKPGGLGDAPHVDGIAGDCLIDAEADRNAPLTDAAERHDATAEAQIADRIMRDDRARFGDQVEIVVIDPDGMDHVQARGQKAEIGGVAHQRPAAEPRLLGGEDTLQPGLQHVGVERQAMRPAEFVQCGEIFR